MYYMNHEWLDGYLPIFTAHHRLLDLVCIEMHSITCRMIRLHDAIYNPDVRGVAPVGREHYDIWRARVPLIFFDIVELHLPDCVLRQFGYEQVIPAPVDTCVDLHKLDRRGNPTEDWSLRNIRYVIVWERRAELVVIGTPTLVPSVSVDYMRWYYSITRLFFSPSFRL
ncbi:unnamed protein product, partial [Cuscuta europaea]